MPEYYNVIQASKYIGADAKTVRRWLKQGRLTGTRTERGWLAIPAEQVEWMKLEWKHEREKFAIPSPPDASLDTHDRESLDSIRRLEDRIAILEEIVAAQTESIEALEKALHRPSFQLDTQPEQSPQITSVDANRSTPEHLPLGTLHSTDFAAQLGLTKPQFEGMLKNGIRGEQLERTKIPTAREGSYTNYFTPEEQERAIALLRRHGKIQ